MTEFSQFEPRTENAVKALKEVLPPFEFGFAYGSGIFPQAGYDYQKSLPLLDFILVVDEADEFHQLNFKRNPGHYSGFPSLLGPWFSSFVQRSLFPIQFFPFTDLPTASGEKIRAKFGVLSLRDFEDDLLNWSFFSCAGRLHKPVSFLIPL